MYHKLLPLIVERLVYDITASYNGIAKMLLERGHVVS
jgi:hypothetical protein